jgi:hypothetical protein
VFESSLAAAARAGLVVRDRPSMGWDLAAVLGKSVDRRGTGDGLEPR